MQATTQQAITTGSATATLPPLSEASPRPIAAAPTAPAPGEVFCRFCGRGILAEAVLCVHCGRQVKDLQAHVAVGEPKETKRISWHIGEIILLIFLIMICPIVGYVYGYIGSKEPGKERQAKVLMVVEVAFNILYIYAYLSAHTPPQPYSFRVRNRI